MNQVYKGKVVFFDAKKGWGFVAREEGGPDLFVHYEHIAGEGYRTLEAGQAVEFMLGENKKGVIATNIKILSEKAIEVTTV